MGAVTGVAAQDPTPTPAPTHASVRVLAVKGIGLLEPDAKPAIPPELQPYRAQLVKLPHARFVAATRGSVVRAAPNTPMEFKSLVLQHEATIRWRVPVQPEPPPTPAPDLEGKLLLELEVTRPGKPPQQGERVQVVEAKVLADDGASFVVQCSKAYPDGDLLLLVTVSSAPF